MVFAKPEDEYYDEMKDEIGEEALRGGKLPAVLTRDEVNILFNVAKEGRDKLIIRLFYATGIRLAECTLSQHTLHIILRGFGKMEINLKVSQFDAPNM